MKHAGVTRTGPPKVQPDSMSKRVASGAVYQKYVRIQRISAEPHSAGSTGVEISAVAGLGRQQATVVESNTSGLYGNQVPRGQSGLIERTYAARSMSASSPSERHDGIGVPGRPSRTAR